MVAEVSACMFPTVDLLFGQARWYRDGQQVFRLHIEALCFPCKIDVKESCLGKCPCNVGDRGTAGFDVYNFIVRCSIRLGQLVEHLINEIVEHEFGSLVKFHSDGDCVITAQFSDAACASSIFRCRHFVEVDVILVVCSD